MADLNRRKIEVKGSYSISCTFPDGSQDLGQCMTMKLEEMADVFVQIESIAKEDSQLGGAIVELRKLKSRKA